MLAAFLFDTYLHMLLHGYANSVDLYHRTKTFIYYHNRKIVIFPHKNHISLIVRPTFGFYD